jgi:hypothetical protein
VHWLQGAGGMHKLCIGCKGQAACTNCACTPWRVDHMSLARMSERCARPAVLNGGRYPLMLKSRTMAYDGRGNAVVKGPADVEAAIQSLVSKVCGAGGRAGGLRAVLRAEYAGDANAMEA